MPSKARSDHCAKRLCWLAGTWRRMRALIMGVRVRETIAEKTMVTASVTANSRNKRPTTSPIKSRGIKTATSETVSENRESDLLGAFQGGLQRRLAFFDI